MSTKAFIKNTLGSFKCRFFGINRSGAKGIYIGKGVSIKGGKNLQLGSGVSIRPYSDIWCGGKVIIGDGSDIGERCRFSVVNELKIGKKVLFSPNVYITDCDHEYRDISLPVMDQGTVKSNSKVQIDDNAYIGINSVIVGNVKIGKGSVIGANSVVTHDVPPFCVVAGSPAKVIKTYNEGLKEWITN